MEYCFCCLIIKSRRALLQPHRLQSARLLSPRGFLGRNTEVGCDFLLHHWATREVPQWSIQFSSVAQSCPTLCDPMNHSTQASLSNTNSRRVLLSHTEEWNLAMCNNMNGHGRYYAKWNKSERKTNMYDFTHIWNLKDKHKKTETVIDTENKQVVAREKEGRQRREIGTWG